MQIIKCKNAETALEILSNSENGIFLSNDLFSVLSKNVGDVINIAVRLDNPTINSSENLSRRKNIRYY